VRYRLVTRSDFDGLVCAVLLRHLDMIEEITFVHPNDVQAGRVEVTARDILTNLPYAPGAHLVFDHHHSETLRSEGDRSNHIIDPQAPSAARVIYEHFGGKKRFPKVSEELMRAVDQADSAGFGFQDILHPQGWTLLSFLMDSRTGLGRFREFRISNYQLMMQLIDACIEHNDVQEILSQPDVKERAELYHEQQDLFIQQLRRLARVDGDVVVVDLRGEKIVHAGNRFMVYALFPAARVSVHVLWGRQKLNTVFACGKSILDRSSPVDIGAVMLRYGGGGHLAAGTCQVPHEQAQRVERELVEALKSPQSLPVS
jgi:nanoRNase/pAp phosphatase (c-di-AMP/oligoRNAs hydrolase)